VIVCCLHPLLLPSMKANSSSYSGGGDGGWVKGEKTCDSCMHLCAFVILFVCARAVRSVFV